jgi:UDP-N-acetylmuramate: L-alanyl-gamma-D-glutamyl-meso-diaminopimelate ligase
VAREHVHLIGIGGTGMTALAGLLVERGARVTGSDRELYPPTSTLLAEMGIEVGTGFDPARLRPDPDLVVVGNAVKRGNPEAEDVLDRRLPHTSMPRILSERFLAGRHSIVVAGTHGKTTTTAMLAWVLHHAGRDPGFLIGGLPRNFARPYALGKGPAFVIEGDEYDTAFFDKGPKFLHYRPDTAIVGTVEFDHADIFRDLAHVRQAFVWLTNIVPRRGLLIRHEDCDLTVDATSGAHSRVEGYGLAKGHWRATELRASEEGSRFVVTRAGAPAGEVRLPLSGEYNVRNALAVIAAAWEQGLAFDEIAAGLATFEGVKRRLETRGEAGGVVVLDDFAHHPTAIAETLRAVRQKYPGRRLFAVLEPRSGTLRRNVFQERLATAFDGADEVVLAEVFGAAEIPEKDRLDPARLVRDIEARGRPARFLPDVPAIVSFLAERTRSGDVVAVLSNGGFGGLHDKLLSALKKKTSRQSITAGS